LDDTLSVLEERLQVCKSTLIGGHQLTKQIPHACSGSFNHLVELEVAWRAAPNDQDDAEEEAMKAHLKAFNKEVTAAQRVIDRLDDTFKSIMLDVNIKGMVLHENRGRQLRDYGR